MLRYQRNSKTISGRLSDELVMMNIEKGKYFSLNPVATRIWDLLETPLTTEELCSLLREEYEVDIEQCRADVTEVLKKMIKMEIIMKI